MSGTVAGRAVTVAQAGMSSRNGTRGKPRFLVEGVNHPKGQPIRFKSLDRAERHIRNMQIGRGA